MPVYVVIGASRGIGYQFLKTLSSQDPSNIIIGTARTVDAAQEKVAADGLKNVHIVHGDMDDHASLTAAARKTAEISGGVVDYLIANGAYFAIPCIFDVADDFVGKEDLFLDELKQIMRTNVAGTLFAFNAFMPLILKSSIKRVSAISSAAMLPEYIVGAEDPTSLHYALSKAALNTLVAKFAARYKQEGVRFVSISPGWVDTHADMPKEFMERMSKPFYRWDKTLKGPISPAQSAEMCLKVMDDLREEQSGEFLSQHGNHVWINGK
ncbi:NAD(P)-binding protein [Karstenula rhodostoma CBS 690.94]|uniref:NAD(P)-binding protein n=1 Tax=Karstenula rhodostoma CBS 690.94 TaxID=1392251 RepID=A0A9P4U5J4_9PLEO|nr:NAD(P)-binding protein [Karstenula rhodostoma CBS 690.94]